MVGNNHEDRITALEVDVKSLMALRNMVIGGWSVVVFLLGVFLLPVAEIILKFLWKGL